MRRSLANLLIILGLTFYWTVHLIAVTAAIHDIRTSSHGYGSLADTLELPVVGLYAASMVLFLGFGDFLGALATLILTCIGLFLAAAIIGLITGVAIRKEDPYGEIPRFYIFRVTWMTCGVSSILVLLGQPRYFNLYLVLAILAIPVVTFAFGRTVRAFAFPRTEGNGNEPSSADNNGAP